MIEIEITKDMIEEAKNDGYNQRVLSKGYAPKKP